MLVQQQKICCQFKSTILCVEQLIACKYIAWSFNANISQFSKDIHAKTFDGQSFGSIESKGHLQ